MDIEITGCKDCPFRDEIEKEVSSQDDADDGETDWITQYYCTHPKRYLVNLIEDYETGIITPSDCPLYKESSTISIKQP